MPGDTVLVCEKLTADDDGNQSISAMWAMSPR